MRAWPAFRLYGDEDVAGLKGTDPRRECPVAQGNVAVNENVSTNT